ncbi:MAG TPA: chromate resistance protein ChrB domain-containing protein [Stellaceae bacterium]|nr:chromate resistance protein ChrB domain-containing protein [Stellaceae bacterium]
MDVPSISPESLYLSLGTVSAPVLVDVRQDAAFDADETMVVGAIRRPPDDVAAWFDKLPRGHQVVAYCVHGHEVSQGVVASLREAGIDARLLVGGIEGWRDAGMPIRRKHGTTPSSWVTRERPKIDRIACPWLIRRFIDPEATFLYVPTDRVLSTAAETGAIAYDIPGAEPFTHDGDLCSYDAVLKVYGIHDAALDRLAVIVRGADTGRPDLAPQAAGLLAISLGLSANHHNDHAMLGHGMLVYDALYAWCRSLQAETHNWKQPA